VAGEILELGPDYDLFVGSSSEVQNWTDCLARQYRKDEELEVIRGIGEEYAARILDYNHHDLARIRPLSHPQTLAWRISRSLGGGEPTRKINEESYMTDIASNRYQTPRICLATGYVMGLVPPAAQVGDVLIRFWGCEAAIVMRPIESFQIPYFILIGQADLASSIAREKAMHAPSYGHNNTTLWESNWILPGATKSSQLPGAVYVNFDLRTLQRITAYTNLYDHWVLPKHEQRR